MASITSFTAARTKEIEDKSIVSGAIIDDHLIFTTLDGDTIDVGEVSGVPGPAGGGVVFLDPTESSTGVPDGDRVCRRYA